MNRTRIQKRFNRIFTPTPELKEIVFSSADLEKKRQRARKFLSIQLMATFDDNQTIPPLEWVLTRDAIRTFRNILAPRSERLSNFSVLRYVNDLLNSENTKDLQMPQPGFFAELEHLVKGVAGETGVYSDKVPAFLKHEGRKAARLRSKDLWHMARGCHKYMDRFPHGLENDAVRRRSTNKSRILNYFGATELEWEKWQWHTRNIIRDADTLNQLVQLTPEEYEAVKMARANKIPFGITPYYLSLMDYRPQREKDYAIRAQVIPPLQYVEKLSEFKAADQASMDFMLECNTSPIDGITRRYPMIVILKPILTCPQICVYCQRNWQIEDVYSKNAAVSEDKLNEALQWIASRSEVGEVLITGGDPFLLANEKIEKLLSKLARMKHVRRIRIGTRTPVTLPQRITDSLVRRITRYHNPGQREIIIITHFEHPYEITPQATEAVQKFKRQGIEVYNQLVYTFYNSRKFEACALRSKLRLIGVTPYYTFNTKGKEETDAYRVPIARLLQEQKEEARLLPGTVRTDQIVFNVPGLGKNNLGESQHHDVISILPDGRRVYEFHPWEKKLALADTYVYTDVAIYEYLAKLKKSGEDTSTYRTIWYYY